uniref:Uncharacterized protein n=1 Tax=Heterorhabditis bacteriophora TaxID=37862 RepID=A0A1I7XQE2_HETBA
MSFTSVLSGQCVMKWSRSLIMFYGIFDVLF